MTWHRFHPLTPFLRGGVMIAAVFGWLLSQQFSRVFGAPADDPTGGHWGIAAVGIVVVVSGGVLLDWISWRAARYRSNLASSFASTGRCAMTGFKLSRSPGR